MTRIATRLDLNYSLMSLGSRRRGAMADDKNDVVIALAASLYAIRATDDAIRAEPNLDAPANEAWDLYHRLDRAVRNTGGEARKTADSGEPFTG